MLAFFSLLLLLLVIEYSLFFVSGPKGPLQMFQQDFAHLEIHDFLTWKDLVSHILSIAYPNILCLKYLLLYEALKIAVKYAFSLSIIEHSSFKQKSESIFSKWQNLYFIMWYLIAQIFWKFFNPEKITTGKPNLVHKVCHS